MCAETIDVGWCDPGYVPGNFAHSIATQLRDMEYFGCAGRIYRYDPTILTWGRNLVVQEFLEGDAPWLWMVDSDMVFDKRHVMKLWETASEHDVKIVSGLAFIFKDRSRPVPSYFLWGNEENGQDPKQTYIPEGYVPEGPIQVAATGLASVLIHRDVFEAMEAPRFDGYRWFDIIDVLGKGKASSEDVQFFLRAFELGFPMMLEPSAETWHIKEIGVGRKDFDRYWELQNAD